jgi:hypothetical protein
MPWYRKGEEIKEFVEAAPRGWEPAGGYYDRQLGVWIDDEPEPKVEQEDEPKAEPVKENKVAVQKRQRRKRKSVSSRA